MLCNSFANMNSKPFKKFYLVKEATYLRNKEKEKEKEQPLLGLQINHGHDLKVANTVKGDSNINCEHQDEKQANTKTFHDTKVIPTSSHVQTQAPPPQIIQTQGQGNERRIQDTSGTERGRQEEKKELSRSDNSFDNPSNPENNVNENSVLANNTQNIVQDVNDNHQNQNQQEVAEPQNQNQSVNSLTNQNQNQSVNSLPDQNEENKSNDTETSIGTHFQNLNYIADLQENVIGQQNELIKDKNKTINTLLNIAAQTHSLPDHLLQSKDLQTATDVLPTNTETNIQQDDSIKTLDNLPQNRPEENNIQPNVNSEIAKSSEAIGGPITQVTNANTSEPIPTSGVKNIIKNLENQGRIQPSLLKLPANKVGQISVKPIQTFGTTDSGVGSTFQTFSDVKNAAADKSDLEETLKQTQNDTEADFVTALEDSNLLPNKKASIIQTLTNNDKTIVDDLLQKTFLQHRGDRQQDSIESIHDMSTGFDNSNNETQIENPQPVINSSEQQMRKVTENAETNSALKKEIENLENKQVTLEKNTGVKSKILDKELQNLKALETVTRNFVRPSVFQKPLLKPSKLDKSVWQTSGIVNAAPMPTFDKSPDLNVDDTVRTPTVKRKIGTAFNEQDLPIIKPKKLAAHPWLTERARPWLPVARLQTKLSPEKRSRRFSGSELPIYTSTPKKNMKQGENWEFDDTVINSELLSKQNREAMKDQQKLLEAISSINELSKSLLKRPS